ncbi:MAG: hypothetical protein AB1424_08930 [Thermodesulfobacteriota bacterium]
MEIKRKAIKLRPPMLAYQMGVDGDIIEFPKKRRQAWSWTEFRLGQAEHVKQVVDELNEYWPLTLRQVYYRLLGVMIKENTSSRYQDLSKLITAMRQDGLLPWEAVEDRTRNLSQKRGFSDKETFVKQELDNLFEGYDRCYVQDQENYVEIWVEKDALSHIIEKASWRYCVRVLTGRGYQSTTVQKNFADRARRAIDIGHIPVVLYFGDYDPSGINILESAIQNIHDKYKLPDVTFIRVALTLDQIHGYDLPLVPLKSGDKRLKDYLQRYGGVAAELDALHPQILRNLTTKALNSLFDLENMNEHVGIEHLEREELAQNKQEILDYYTSMLKR